MWKFLFFFIDHIAFHSSFLLSSLRSRARAFCESDCERTSRTLHSRLSTYSQEKLVQRPSIASVQYLPEIERDRERGLTSATLRAKCSVERSLASSQNLTSFLPFLSRPNLESKDCSRSIPTSISLSSLSRLIPGMKLQRHRNLIRLGLRREIDKPRQALPTLRGSS